MTRAPDRATLLNSVLQNVLYVADTDAVHHIQEYADLHGVADLEDVTSPYEPSLDATRAHQAAPALDGHINDAVDNPANWSPFAIKTSDILDTVTMDASKQARKELPAKEWTALVQAAAAQILHGANEARHSEAVALHIADSEEH